MRSSMESAVGSSSASINLKQSVDSQITPAVRQFSNPKSMKDPTQSEYNNFNYIVVTIITTLIDLIEIVKRLIKHLEKKRSKLMKLVDQVTPEG